MGQVISTKKWMHIISHSGVFSSSRYGFTPRAETNVWSWRKLDEHMLYFCIHGGFQVVFEDHAIDLEKGSFVWIMPEVRHETRLLAGRKTFRTFYLRFAMASKDGGALVRLKKDLIHRTGAWDLLPFLRELIDEMQSPREFHEERLRANLLLLSAAALSEKTQQHRRAVLTSQQRLRLQSYINAQVTKATPDSLAAEVGLSMPYFRRVFHRSYGMSPSQWIVRQRIMLAAMIMSETELTAKEVAYQLGYCNCYLFSRQFKQVMGMTTRAFRRGAGGEPQWRHISDDMTASPLRQVAGEQALRSFLRHRSGRTT